MGINPFVPNNLKVVVQWALYTAKWPTQKSQTACRSLGKFCSLLSNKLQWLYKLQDPWRSGFLCGARMHPLHLPNPWFICQNTATVYFSQLTNTVRHSLLCLSLVLQSTVGWNINTGLWNEH